MGSYTCAGYSRLSTGIAGERTGGTRQHTMQTAQSLEEQANMFLSVADATTEEGSFAASTVEVGNMFTCVEGLDMWAAAAGMYGTEGDDGELAWQAEALCAQTDPEAFFPEKGGSTRMPKGCAVYAPYAKSVYNMQWTMTSASASGAVCQNENAADYASRRAKPGRYNPHADCATVLPPNLPTRGDRHPPLLLRGLHRNHR